MNDFTQGVEVETVETPPIPKEKVGFPEANDSKTEIGQVSKEIELHIVIQDSLNISSALENPI